MVYRVGRPSSIDTTEELRRWTDEELNKIMRALSDVNSGHIIGDVSGNPAGPGEVGEILDLVVPYAGTPILSGAITNVGSKVFTPGRWIVWITGGFVPSPTTVTKGAIGAVSTQSGVLQNTPVSRLQFLPIPETGFTGAGIFGGLGFNVGPTPFNFAAPTTLYFIGFSVFTGTSAVFGHMQGLRTS